MHSLFIRQVFIEHLLCARHSRCRCKQTRKKKSCPSGGHTLGGRHLRASSANPYDNPQVKHCFCLQCLSSVLSTHFTDRRNLRISLLSPPVPSKIQWDLDSTLTLALKFSFLDSNPAVSTSLLWPSHLTCLGLHLLMGKMGPGDPISEDYPEGNNISHLGSVSWASIQHTEIL